MAVNCASIPETLLENELFGHRRGAFTGADLDSPGKIQAAEGRLRAAQLQQRFEQAAVVALTEQGT